MVPFELSLPSAMNSEITGEDFLDFKCPYCGALNSFPTSAARLARECMNCLETFLVPESSEGAARRLPLPVEGSRLRLRRFEPGDWKDLLEFQFEDEDEATGWLHSISQARLTEVRQPFYLAVQVRDTGKVIGSLSWTFTDPSLNQMEISVTAGKAESLPSWELEAFETALDFCFQELHLHRVYAQCDRDDSDSRRLFMEAGLRQEAEFVKNHFVDGEWQTTLWFAMLEEEYFSEPSPEEKKTS
jgi:RimJ/RimL family protein N-acetyltransferase